MREPIHFGSFAWKHRETVAAAAETPLPLAEPSPPVYGKVTGRARRSSAGARKAAKDNGAR
jgi:hypothetical protein